MASFIFDYKYLSAENLAGFDKYKYKSIDTSPLSKYVMHPFWNQLVKIFPLWVPANLLTLVGWLITLFGFLLVSYYDPHFHSSNNPGAETVPRWVWLVGGLFIFIAHQLDGCDGKQARRTNSSSPLGELFDHGLDSISVWLMAVGILSIFGVGEKTAMEWELVYFIIAVLFAFYVAHWEKYTTSILYLPWAYDVSQIWLASSYLVTYIYGCQMWTVTFFDGAYDLPFILKSILTLLISVFCVPMSLFNQYKAYNENPEDCKSVFEGTMPLFSLGSVTSLYLMYGYASSENIVESQLRLYFVAYGILYSNITCRLIIAQMTGSFCDRFNILAWPLFPMIALTMLKVASDRSVLICYVLFLSVAHLHYGLAVVHQLCDHLNVYCFKVGLNGHSHSNGTYSNGLLTNGKIAKD